MAKEKIIEIKTGEAVKNISDLKNNITALKQQLGTLTIGTDEYRKTLRQLEDNQAALRNAMHGTASSYSEVMNASQAADIELTKSGKIAMEDTYSYNQLVRTLGDLKEQWRGTTNAAERLDLGRRINAVNDKLKEMDASVGTFGRNVGNYVGAVDHLTSGLASMGKGAASIVNPLRGVTAGFKTLSATPAIAILGALATVLTKIIDGLKTSEENTEGLTRALAPFQAIGDAITQMLQGMGKALVSVVEWFGKLTAAIFKNNDAANERLRIAKEQDALDKSQRETLVKNAEAERDIAELRAKATEKDKYTATERLAMLEEAGRLEAEIADRAREDAKKAYEIIRDRNALTESSKEQKEEEARAYADMVKAETAYYQQIRTINQGITRARREEAKDAREAAKAVKDAATAKINAEKEYLEQVLEVTKAGTDDQLRLQNEIADKERGKARADAVQKIKNQTDLANALDLIDKKYYLALEKNQQAHDNAVLAEELRSIANRRDALQKGSVEYAAAQKEYAAAALDGLKQQMDETDEEFKARQLEAQRALVEAGNALNDAVLKETTDAIQAQMGAVADGSVEYLALSLEKASAELDGMYQGIDESLDAFNARRLEKAREVREAEDALETARVERDHTILAQRMALLEEGSMEYLAREVELKAYELDTLHQLEGESNEAFRLRQLEAEKAYSDALKAEWRGRLSLMQQVAGGLSGIIGSIADMMDTNTEQTEEEAKRVKNLRIAGATIDMLQGAVTAYAGAQSLGVPMGPIVGAINAAAVVAAGVANIAKIRATKVDAKGGGTEAAVPATVSAPSVSPDVQQVRTITGASEEERLNRMAGEQRVYILDSDLQAADNSRKVQVAETTW